jgi:hypothetical protein
MPTKLAITDRKLRSQASEDDIVSEVKFNIRTNTYSRSNPNSHDWGNDTILNTCNDTNMSEQRGGGEKIDLTNVKQTVRVEVPGEEERKRLTMMAAANVFVPALAPPTVSLDASKMMMAMMVQFQEQACLDQEQICEDQERAWLDTLQLQWEITELQNAQALWSLDILHKCAEESCQQNERRPSQSPAGSKPTCPWATWRLEAQTFRHSTSLS